MAMIIFLELSMSNKWLNKFISLKSFLVFASMMVFLFASSFSFASENESRQFIIIVDNSGSMFGSSGADERRYSIQASKIINDLLSSDDSLSLIRLTNNDSCGGYNGSIVAEGGGASAKAKFDSHIVSSSGSDHFSVPIATATELFKRKKADRQLLLIITDVFGDNLLGGCDRKSNLKALKQMGVELTGININDGDVTRDNSLFSEAKFIQDSQQLIDAIARVYQRFIGGKNPSTGVVKNQKIEFVIDNYVKDAYLVVAADGEVGSIKQSSGNPKVHKIDINYKNGGITKGWDAIDRSYKIVHLTRPKSGNWRFELSDLRANAGWMLIQDYSVGIRFEPISTVAQGIPVTIKAHLFDEITKKDVLISNDMSLEMLDQQGDLVSFTHDNRTFTTTITPKNVGKLRYMTRLRGKHLDKKSPIEFNVIKGSWVIQANVPTTSTIGKAAIISIKLHTKDKSSGLKRPTEVIATLSTGEKIKLKQSGKNSLEYLADWTPKKVGKVSIEFTAKGGNKVLPAKAETNVVGDAKFGKPIPIDFGKTGSKNTIERVLDFSDAKVFGSLPITIETAYAKKNSSLLLNNDGEWIDLSNSTTVTLKEGGQNQWAIRLRVEGCPEGVDSTENFTVRAWFKKSDGVIEETLIPVKMEIVEDAWIVCWWPFILGAILTGILLWVIHCIRSPARFPSTFELLLAAEDELREEGILHKILNYKGTKSGFCRDARIYMHQDMRFTKSPKGAFIKFQARKNGVYIVVLGNGTLWYQRYGMEWEKEPMNEEVLLRTGATYRNDSESLFFEAKNI